MNKLFESSSDEEEFEGNERKRQPKRLQSKAQPQPQPQPTRTTRSATNKNVSNKASSLPPQKYNLLTRGSTRSSTNTTTTMNYHTTPRSLPTSRKQQQQSMKEKSILEQQVRLAAKLSTTSNSNGVSDLVNTPKKQQHQQQQQKGNDGSLINKTTTQQRILQKSKQRKMLNSLFNSSGTAITTTNSANCALSSTIRNDGAVVTSVDQEKLPQPPPNTRSVSSHTNAKRNPPSLPFFSQQQQAAKRKKMGDTNTTNQSYSNNTHIRPKSSSASNRTFQSDQQHPIPSAQSAIAQARLRTAPADKSSSHKRPLRRATNNNPNASTSTSTKPIHYAKVEPDDYWKNIRTWDLLSDLNEQQQQQMNYRPVNKNKNLKNQPHLKGNNDNNGNCNRGYNTNTKNKTEDNKDNNTKTTPDSISKAAPATSTTPATTPLPCTFESARQYKALWAPLCLQETRAQILSEFMEKITYLRNNLSTKLMPVTIKPVIRDVGGCTDYITLQLHRDTKRSNFYENTNNNRENGYMFNDLLLLIKDKSFFSMAIAGQLDDTALNLNLNKDKNTKQKQQSKQLIRNDIHTISNNTQKGIVGHVDAYRKTIDGLLIKVSRNIWPIVGSTEMLLFRISGCNVTSLREFTALCRVNTIPLLNDLLGTNITTSLEDDPKSKSKSISVKTDDLPKNLGKGFTRYAKAKYNSSQLGAISNALKEYGNGGFTLVKGPPGTGKTTTLVALLNSLHIRQYNIFFEEIRSIITKTSYTDQSAMKNVILKASKSKPYLLVCAPSNTAIDNIILKIMEGGFLDGNGKPYKPPIIRVGIGQGLAVKDVGLEAKVDAVLCEGSSIEKITVSIKEHRRTLFNLKTRYKQLRQRIQALELAVPWPLEKHWEIRINEKSFDDTSTTTLSGGDCYFVNHTTKKTQMEIPAAPDSPNAVTFIASSMPDYINIMQQLCLNIEKYLGVLAKVEQLELSLKIATMRISTTNNDQAMLSATRQQLQTHILDHVHIVLTTLGTAGSNTLESLAKFEVIVIDEAAQSVEPAILSALQLGSSHAILVGDPQQLPATIFSVSGRGTKYDRSLFQRLEESGLHYVHLLDTQYRMHPDISDFPRRIFYDGNLGDGENVKHPEYGASLKRKVFQQLSAFRSFTLLDLDSSEERGGTSLSNSSEAQLAVHLYSTLDKVTSGEISKCKVAVITPYKEQISVLKRFFDQQFGHNKKNVVDIHTVDSYQGKEADVVIFSCVRASGNKTIGFLSDVRRMNVALTRAKHFLFVIARVKSIVVNPYWRQLVEHAREKEAVIYVPIYSSSRNSGGGGASVGRNNRGDNGVVSFPDLKTLKALPPPPPQRNSKNIPVKQQSQQKQVKEVNNEEEGELSDFSA